MVQTMAINEITELMLPPTETAEFTWFRVSVLKKANSNLNLDNLQVIYYYYK